MDSETGGNTNTHIVCSYCLTDSNKYNRCYFLSDASKSYETMLKDTFDIQICCLNSFEQMICFVCAEDIRSAAEAKKKFVNVQSKLLELTKKKFKEFVGLGDLLKQENDDSGDEYGCGDRPDDEIDDKNLKTDDNAPLKMNGEANEKNTCNIEIKIKSETLTVEEAPSPSKRRKNMNLSKKIKRQSLGTNGAMHVKKKIINRINDKEKPKLNYSESLQSMKVNTLNLLSSSNMILFKSKKTKFACYACDESYLDIRLLRDHSQSHTVLQDSLKDCLSRCRGLTYKFVDISNLACTKCASPCRDLHDLHNHLELVHKEIFQGSEHLLIPFKLEEGFKCVICHETFYTFCRLSIHMNSHSTRNVCETCGVAFTNRRSLRNHINASHTMKKCPKCLSVFANKAAVARHLRMAHNSGQIHKRYCPKCEMTFTYAYQLAQHMIEKHGAKTQVSACGHCGKQFRSPGAVKIHTRAVHVGERNYPCGICEMRFFTSYDKSRHERTHGEEKTLSCEFCEVKFKSRDSVKRHLKKQHSQ